MNNSVLFFIIILFLVLTNLEGCPTCVGRVSGQSAPFFSEECYKHSKKSKSKDKADSADNEKSESEQGKTHEH